MKKSISLILVFALVMGVFAIVPLTPTANATSVDGLKFELNDDGESYCVSGYTESVSVELEIPDTYNSLPVTSIGDKAFFECISLTSVILPDSITTIGDYAFNDCVSLISVTMGDGVTSIGEGAFYNCTVLTDIVIPDSVTSIGESVFYNCYDLSNVTIGNGVTSISNFMFAECMSLTSITIPDSVTSIGGAAFYECIKLTSIAIPDKVTSIGEATFYYCRDLVSVTIPDSVTEIHETAFAECSKELVFIVDNNDYVIEYAEKNNFNYILNSNNKETLVFELNNDGQSYSVVGNNITTETELVIPDTYNGFPVTSLDEGVFRGCDYLKNITISNSVTSIGAETFVGCSSLETVNIPESVTYINIGEGFQTSPFSNCTSLKEINVDESNPNYSSIDGVLFNKDKTALISYPIGKNADSYDVPDTVIDISRYAFNGCLYLINITISKSVRSIGMEAFDCHSLENVYITDIKNWCLIDFEPEYRGVSGGHTTGNCMANPMYCATNLFLNNELVTEIVIPEGITEIKDYSFFGFDSLKSVTITNGVTEIGTGAFEGCSSLEKIIIPEGVTHIGSWSFDGCKSLKSINIPKSLTTIGVNTFGNCVSLEAVYITDISDWCSIDFYVDEFISNPLYYANNLYLNGELVIELVIPDDVTEIKRNAFCNCTSLITVTIPDSVTSIDYSAFENCSSLKYVFYTGSSTDWGSISIGSNNSPLTSAKIHYNATGHSHSCSIESAPTEQENGKAIDTCPVCGFINGEEDIVYINDHITAVDTKNAVVDTTRNTLVLDMSACKDINEAIVEMDGYTLTTAPTSSYGFIGTGSKVQVADSTGTQVAEYTLVVRGDVNGDSVCDVLDCMLLELARHESNNVSLEGVYFAAGNLAEDNEINIDDVKAVVNKALALA